MRNRARTATLKLNKLVSLLLAVVMLFSSAAFLLDDLTIETKAEDAPVESVQDAPKTQIALDLRNGSITINNDTYTCGSQSGPHSPDNNYVITTGGEKIDQSITLAGAGLVCTLTLKNVNTTGNINIVKGSGNGKNIVLMLEETNIVGRVNYSGTSKLYITSAAGDGETSGQLTASSVNWDAAIGSTDADNEALGITIAGGTIYATATSAAAIGGGGNGNAEILITGGNITANNRGNSATIGGGGSNNGEAGYGRVTVTGGTVSATNSAGNGAGIGGGGVNGGVAGDGFVRIEDGIVTVKVKGTGAGIGGGGASYGVDGSGVEFIGTAGDGDVFISGESTKVTVNPVSASQEGENWGAGIGGGGATGGKAGNGVVRIEGGTVSSTMKGTGACIGGGGASTVTMKNATVKNGDAGNGTVVITGGSVTAMGLYILERSNRGVAIGGGTCHGAGTGGKATVTILGGGVTAWSRGLGATIGSGGSLNGTTQDGVIAISGSSTVVNIMNNGTGMAIGSGCIDDEGGATPGDAHISISHGAKVYASIIVQKTDPPPIEHKKVISAGSNPGPSNGTNGSLDAAYGSTYYEQIGSSTVVEVGYAFDFDQTVTPLPAEQYISSYGNQTLPTETPMLLDLAQGHIVFEKNEQGTRIVRQQQGTSETVSNTWTYLDDRECIVVQSVNTPVNHRVAFVGNDVDYAVTLHGINSSAQDSIKAEANVGNEKRVTINLSGTNKINNLFYFTAAAANPATIPSSTLTLKNASGTEAGELIVRPSGGTVYHGAGIGGKNTGAKSITGLIIESGTIDVRVTKENQCVAIGGGGNGYAQIEIRGGNVIAESWCSGASIGGGLAFSGVGSYADVTISGGNVTAINHGTDESDTVIPRGDWLYGTAIGGGSSYQSGTSNHYSTVTITGGEVYAAVRLRNEEMVAGSLYTAIGGGNSHNGSAGNGRVLISGGHVVCEGNLGGGSSVKGNGGAANVEFSQNCHITCTGSVGGGGTVDADGGDATVTIAGGFGSIASGIGGGYSTSGLGGTATLICSDGTFSTSSIGGGYSVEKGYSNAEVTITGGSLNGYMAAYPENAGNFPVYLTTITLIDANENVLSNCKVTMVEYLNKQIYHYGLDFVQTDEDGKIYLWLPESLTEVTTITTAKGIFQANVPVASEGATNPAFKIIFMTEVAGEYEIWLNNELTEGYESAVVAKQGTQFAFYVETQANYYLNVQILHSPNDNQQVRSLESASYDKHSSEHGDWKTLQYHFEVTSDTIVLITYGTDLGYNTVFDLTQGNIVVNEDGSSFDVTYGGYEIQNISGQFLLTTGAHSTNNTVTVNSGIVKMKATNLMVENAQSVFRINGGTLELTADYHDNQISSTGQEAIWVAQGAMLDIALGTGDSLKVIGNDHAISGPGTVHLTEEAENTHLQVGVLNGENAPIFSGGFSYTTGYDRENGWASNEDTLLHRYSPYKNDGEIAHFYGFTDNHPQGSTLYSNIADIPSATAGMTYTAHTIRADAALFPTGADLADHVYSFAETPASIILTQNGMDICVIDQLDPTKNKNAGWLDAEDRLNVGDGYWSGALVLTVSMKVAYDVIAKDVTVTYDGSSHSVSVVVTNQTDTPPAVSYTLAGNAFAGEENVGVYTITWTVSPTGFYRETSGSVTLTIRKAENDWMQELSCAGTLAGNMPNPTAAPQFGNVTYLFYSDADGKTAISPPETEGTYYVRAVVAGTENYTGLSSNIVSFVIGEAYSFVTAGRLLNQISANTQSVEIARQGAATALVGIDINESSLYLRADASGTIPAGTVITLIHFEDGDVTYYFYRVGAATNYISLTEFVEMGTNAKFALTTTELITVQICLCFPESATTDMTLYLTDNLQENANATAFEIGFQGNRISAPSGNVSTGDMEIDEDNEISTTVTVSNLQNLVADASDVRHINRTLQDYRAYLVVHLYQNGAEIAIPDAAVITANGNRMTLRGGIAITPIIDDVDDYEVAISGLFGGTYHIVVELCAENEDGENVRALVLGTSQASDVVTVTEKHYALWATMADLDSRIIDASAENVVLSFDISYHATVDGEIAVFSQYRRTDSMGKPVYYDTYPLWTGCETIVVSEGAGTVQCQVTVPQGVEAGTYRIAFVLGDALYNYNILIK